MTIVPKSSLPIKFYIKTLSAGWVLLLSTVLGAWHFSAMAVFSCADGIINTATTVTCNFTTGDLSISNTGSITPATLGANAVNSSISANTLNNLGLLRGRNGVTASNGAAEAPGGSGGGGGVGVNNSGTITINNNQQIYGGSGALGGSGGDGVSVGMNGTAGGPGGAGGAGAAGVQNLTGTISTLTNLGAIYGGLGGAGAPGGFSVETE